MDTDHNGDDKPNVFVVGLDDFHLSELMTLPHASDYAFHPLFSYAELRGQDEVPVWRLIDDGEARLHAFPGNVDAIVGYWDFPVSTVLPILRRRIGLATTSLESVLKCEHKYWSRLEQAQVAPEHVPRFCAVDPFADDPLAQIDIPFPFWIKPVKCVLSYLGFRIENDEDFAFAIATIREHIGRFAEPFNYVLERADLPPEVEGIDGHHCIVESLISAGRQCTLEGYAFQGDVHVYGTIDSLREGAAGSSFSRYQYPSSLPDAVQERMTDITRQVIQKIEYDDAPFNIEFFWDEQTDRISLLEINSRISVSHATLFYMVDGRSHHDVMVELGLGHEPAMPIRQGDHACAAKFMVRREEDAFVSHAPTREELEVVEATVPGARIQVHVRDGMRLSDLIEQDSYTYLVATVFVGADREERLETLYRQALDALPLVLEETLDTHETGTES